MRVQWSLGLALLAFPAGVLRAQATAEVYGGSAWNFPTRLSIPDRGTEA